MITDHDLKLAISFNDRQYPIKLLNLILIFSCQLDIFQLKTQSSDAMIQANDILFPTDLCYNFTSKF